VVTTVAAGAYPAARAIPLGSKDSRNNRLARKAVFPKYFPMNEDLLEEKIIAFDKGIAALLSRIRMPEKEAPSLQKALKQATKNSEEAFRYLFSKLDLPILCLTIFQAQQENGIEAAVQTLSEEDITAIEWEAEALMREGNTELSGKLFQWLTLFSSNGDPNLYAFLMLAEDMASRDLAVVAKFYDFLVKLFPQTQPYCCPRRSSIGAWANPNVP
jgi:hypothetical protein